MNRKALRIRDLVDKEIYYYSWSYGTCILEYIKHNESLRSTKGIINCEYKSDKLFAFCDNFYEATPEEKRHLKACIAANKYVELPKEEIINSYQIF